MCRSCSSGEHPRHACSSGEPASWFDWGAAAIDEAVRLDPTAAGHYYNRGLTYDKKGDTAKAKADFAKAKELGYKPE